MLFLIILLRLLSWKKIPICFGLHSSVFPQVKLIIYNNVNELINDKKSAVQLILWNSPIQFDFIFWFKDVKFV